ncbi:hypothetical protein Prum_082050 [Phytohabitans rumicis]|uniref:Uncharacterized protein n=1 Tax=Phytohabitans rumicis TaxID=1076125 RepID=A0A6V8LBH2_9ACTN|nr:hypothetical protein Prum_082050 [Phytohabitans rumicis]
MRASGLAKRTPCQPSDTCGPDTPSPRRNRPPDSASIVAAVIAVAAGVRAGICMTALPRSMVEVWPAIQARVLGESEPYASAAHTTAYPSRSASWAMARWSAGVVHAV